MNQSLNCMNLADLVEQFRAKLEDRPEGPSDAVAAIETLLDLIRSSKGVYSCTHHHDTVLVYSRDHRWAAR